MLYEVITQVLVFVVISVILLVATRPLVKKFMLSKTIPTNSELDVGKKAVVIEEINTLHSKGRVRVGDVNWTAITDSNTVIPEGTTVTVEKIDGAKLIVKV